MNNPWLVHVSVLPTTGAPPQVISRHAACKERALAWFGTFSVRGLSDSGPGSRALGTFCLAERSIAWEHLRWRFRPQAPATVAHKLGYFAELDVAASLEQLLRHCPEFWEAPELREACASDAWIATATAFFTAVRFPRLCKHRCDVRAALLCTCLWHCPHACAALLHTSLRNPSPDEGEANSSMHPHVAASQAQTLVLQELEAELTAADKRGSSRAAERLLTGLLATSAAPRALSFCLEHFSGAVLCRILSCCVSPPATLHPPRLPVPGRRLSKREGGAATLAALEERRWRIVLGAVMWRSANELLLTCLGLCRPLWLAELCTEAAAASTAENLPCRGSDGPQPRGSQSIAPPEAVSWAVKATDWAIRWRKCAPHDHESRLHMLEAACASLGWCLANEDVRPLEVVREADSVARCVQDALGPCLHRIVSSAFDVSSFPGS